MVYSYGGGQSRFSDVSTRKTGFILVLSFINFCIILKVVTVNYFCLTLYNEILLSLIEEGNSDTCLNMGEPWGLLSKASHRDKHCMTPLI